MTSSTTSSSQHQTQSGTIDPWKPTIPTLTGIVDRLQPSLDAYQANPVQQDALKTLAYNAKNNTPVFTGNVNELASNLSNGGYPFDKTLNNSYLDFLNVMGPLSNKSLDPRSDPGMQDVLATIQNDVGNSVNGQFAGAGRDLSGMNQTAIARGISQGEAVPLLNQYNQNVATRFAAGNALADQGRNVSQALGDFQQTRFNDQLLGSGSGGQLVNQAYNAPANAALQAEAQAYGLPLGNLGQIESLAVPIAGLGKQYQSVSDMTGSSSSTPSALSSIGAIGGLLFSEPDMKTEKREVGELHDGQKIYSYKYKDDPTGTTQIGLMADEVQKKAPEAVGLLGGKRAVDYKKATDKAAKKAGKK